MPIIRKLIKMSDSKLLTIPKSWLTFYEKEAGVTEITQVSVEVNKALIVRPILPGSDVVRQKPEPTDSELKIPLETNKHE